jgi:hypothetical protein
MTDASKIFYYHQYDALAEMSLDKPWTFAEVRPDLIIGFTPTTNAMNAALGLGIFLSLAREVHGAGAEIPFPGSEKAWRALHTETFQDVLGKMNLFATLKCGDGEVLNCTNGDIVSWEQKWKGVCEWFELKGVPPDGKGMDVAGFVEENAGVWQELVERKGLKKGIVETYFWMFLGFILNAGTFDRQYDLSRAREVGFNETIDTVEAWKMSFQRMRDAKIIP